MASRYEVLAAVIEQTAGSYGRDVFSQDGETWEELLRILHEFEREHAADPRPFTAEDVYGLLDEVYDLLSAAWVYVDFDRPRADLPVTQTAAYPSQSPLGESDLGDMVSGQVPLDLPAVP